MKKWPFDADYLQASNCDYGCPCEFSAPPSQGCCEGLGAWHIKKDEYAGSALDGLSLAFAAKWPGAIHQGNGTPVFFVDEKSFPEQRDALLEISSGKAGGTPFEILATTFSTLLEPRFVPFDFNLDGLRSSVRLGDRMRIALEPIKNPVPGEEENVLIDHGSGFVFKKAECTSARAGEVQVKDLEFSYPDKVGFIACSHYHN